MRSKTKVTKSVALTVALIAGITLAAVAEAQGPRILRGGEVSRVEIAVWDPGSRVEIGLVRPEDTLVLDAGDSVVLRVVAPRGHAPGDSRQYLPAKLSVARGGGAELADVDESAGSALLKASPQRGVAEIAYELDQRIEVARPGLAKGSFRVDVQALSKGQRVVKALYLGILMHDVDYDSAEARERIAEVERQGYPAVVAAAREIASGDESRTKIYDRNHTREERLAALYEHLLALEPREFDKYQMEDHMAMMRRGDVVGVVMDIVGSPEFRRAHNYNR